MFPADSAEIRCFSTFEERETAFRQRVFSLVPRNYLGPARFWRDFRKISMERLLAFAQQPVACIPGDPGQCLAFGTPWQVLAAAVLTARQADPAFSLTPEALAESVGLEESLRQPVRTLSGGETVKLALAKSRAAIAVCRRLAVASPFSWLSMENRMHFHELLADCSRRSVEAELFVLDGEDDAEPVSREASAKAGEAVAFSLVLEDLRIPLTQPTGLLGARTAVAAVENIEANLVSPCLWTGNNGQGKSLVAKVLARTVPFAGTAVLAGASGPGSARLLFQDVMTQTLLRTPRALGRTGAGAREKADLDRIRKRILERCTGPEDGYGTGESKDGMGSLLAVKALLVALRLCWRPAALILDEPDWGLARRTAIDFVLAVMDTAHGMGVPVILISHKPWWTPLAQSRIAVSRSVKSVSADRAGSFDIHLRLEKDGP